MARAMVSYPAQGQAPEIYAMRLKFSDNVRVSGLLISILHACIRLDSASCIFIISVYSHLLSSKKLFSTEFVRITILGYREWYRNSVI